MKKQLIALLAVLMLSTAAFATGPLMGFSVVPVAGQPIDLHIGWDFGSVHIEATKDSLDSYKGMWTFGAIGTPQAELFGYRAGARMLWNWQSSVKYGGFEFLVGLSKTWGPLQVYGDLVLTATSTLGVTPVIGVNILFSELFEPAI